MTNLRVRRTEGDSLDEVSDQNPLPVAILQDVQSKRVLVSAIPTQIVVSTSVPTLICPFNVDRRSVLLTNLTGTQICHLRNDNTVTASNSRAMLTGAVGSNVTFYAKDSIYGLSASAAQTILVWEESYIDGQP